MRQRPGFTIETCKGRGRKHVCSMLREKYNFSLLEIGEGLQHKLKECQDKYVCRFASYGQDQSGTRQWTHQQLLMGHWEGLRWETYIFYANITLYFWQNLLSCIVFCLSIVIISNNIKKSSPWLNKKNYHSPAKQPQKMPKHSEVSGRMSTTWMGCK